MYSERLDEVLPNNTIVAVTLHIQGNQNGLACATSRQPQSRLGTWSFPDGTAVTDDQSSPLFALRQINRVTLYRGSDFDMNGMEGVYMCEIRDENDDPVKLYAGIYTQSSYQNSGEFIIVCNTILPQMMQ